MRPLTAIRSSGALWFVPVFFALGTTLPLLNPFPLSGYAASDISSASISLGHNGPLLAGFVAFACRGRARLHRPLRSTRSGTSITLGSLWPLLIGAPAMGCLAVLITARTLPADTMAWRLLMVDAAVLLGCALLGVLFAWALPSVISVPTATIACFIWIDYWSAADSRLLQNLAPSIDGFGLDVQPARAATVAVLILVGTVAIGSVACLGRHGWDRTPAMIAIPSAAAIPAVAVGLAAASLQFSPTPLTFGAGESRTSALDCQTTRGLEVCLWPEAEGHAKELGEIASSLNPLLNDWDLPGIAAIGQGGLSESAINVYAEEQSTSTSLRASVAHGYVFASAGCEDATGPAIAERIALLSIATGVTDNQLRKSLPPRSLASAREVLANSASPQLIGAWYTNGLTDARCPAR